MEKYINDFGKECYRGVSEDTPFTELDFHEVPDQIDEDRQFVLHTDLGSLSVLNRMTGFGHRDVETGYRAPDGLFWLASGHLDVRTCGAKTIGEAIQWIKDHANNCVGI